MQFMPLYPHKYIDVANWNQLWIKEVTYC